MIQTSFAPARFDHSDFVPSYLFRFSCFGFRASLLANALVIACTCGGCNWLRNFRIHQPHVANPPPVVFQAGPTRDQVIAAVNANTSRVQTLHSQGSMSIAGVPALNAEIAVERPRKFRFRAGTSLLGPELDLGSNDELFWFWAQRSPEPGVFYARHDQFAASRARQMIPIEPAALVEALGLLELDPSGQVEGPAPLGSDRLEMRVRTRTAGGELTRVLYLHNQYAWVLEQHLYGPQGQHLATAKASEFEFYPAAGVSLPHEISMQVPDGQLAFSLTLPRHTINQLTVDPTTFDLPQEQLANYQFYDIASPNFVPPGGTPAQPASMTPRTSRADDGYPQRYRGYKR
jgi:hypothetical protein